MGTRSEPLAQARAVATIAAIDLGKTSCRLRIVAASDPSDPLYETTDSGAPGLADSRGVSLALSAVERVLSQYGDHRGRPIDSLVIGAAGTEAAPSSALELSETVRRAAGCPVVVASDVMIAHAGAFAGRSGTVLIAGTGAVALGLDDLGEFHQSDGWGPWVGDEGSGQWIGQHGLRAALRATDGRGRPTALADSMRDLIGTAHDVPGWVARGNEPARTLATFALAVIDNADRGDAVAQDILDRAVEHLGECARAASSADSDVVVVGGLASNGLFRSLLDTAIRSKGLSPALAAGGPLDGARLLAVDRLLPYESKVFRAE